MGIQKMNTLLFLLETYNLIEMNTRFFLSVRKKAVCQSPNYHVVDNKTSWRSSYAIIKSSGYNYYSCYE